jgi:acetolactate synthase-1/2/3 large subunit
MLGMHGNQAANLAVQECDLLIVVGARFDDRATGKLAEFAPKRTGHPSGSTPPRSASCAVPTCPACAAICAQPRCHRDAARLDTWRAHCRD